MTAFGGYRLMWMLVMFDLPVTLKKQRRRATRFRKDLLDLGFEMNQFSVYMRFCASREAAETMGRKIRRRVPKEGTVSILTFTDKQYARMKVFHGDRLDESDRERKQLLLL